MRRNQLAAPRRAQKLFGMRIEGDGQRTRAGAPRLDRGGGKNLLVAQVHAVKVADGGNGGTEK